MKSISVAGGKLATWSEGHGPSIIFLHGGPGDTHHYMKRMAAPLFDKFQCIFFDQRGAGLSEVESRESSQFRLELMLDDLLAVKNAYTSEKTILVGHSWGAMYGLFACMTNPEHFSRAALLNMGPLDDEAGKQTSENLLMALIGDERHLWSELREKRNAARDHGDLREVMDCDRQMMKLRVKSWIFDPNLHEPFLKDYFQDPPPDREVNKWVWNSFENRFSWDQVRAANMPLWLCVGKNDSVPTTQAKKISELAPQAKLTIYENCGHIPWMEHPDRFYRDLTNFLEADTMRLVHTDSDNNDFLMLTKLLDDHFAKINGAAQEFFQQYNRTNLRLVVVAYIDGVAVGCGALKIYSDDTVEIKRMFVQPAHRGAKIGFAILTELEQVARRLNFKYSLLETSKYNAAAAVGLYSANGYQTVENYDQYLGVSESICMRKTLST